MKEIIERRNHDILSEWARDHKLENEGVPIEDLRNRIKHVIKNMSYKGESVFFRQGCNTCLKEFEEKLIGSGEGMK